MVGRPKKLIEYLYNQLGDNREKLFELKEYKQKRSLKANAYAWSLITKIADVLRVDKELAYLMLLKRYGQSEIISVLSSIGLEGYFKYFEVVGRGRIQGKEFTHYKIYKGSSEFNTYEMAVFIDGIVSECKELDIETLPPGEIERLKEEWRR